MRLFHHPRPTPKGVKFIMSLLTRFDDAIRSFSQQTAQQNGGAKGPGNAEVDSVLVVLDPLMKQATQEFRAIRLGETSVPNAAVFLLDSESVLMKSMLIFEQGTGKFFRRDELDLNLPEKVV